MFFHGTLGTQGKCNNTRNRSSTPPPHLSQVPVPRYPSPHVPRQQAVLGEGATLRLPNDLAAEGHQRHQLQQWHNGVTVQRVDSP